MTSATFWKGKKVLVTGHTGFKGAWLCLLLKNYGAAVTGFALSPTERSLYHESNVARHVESQLGDIRNPELIATVLHKTGPDIVIHMAAQALVRYSYEHPVETYSTNVMGLVNLLEAVRNSNSVRSVVVVTSDKCYENREWVWGYREDEPMGGSDPYSSSKGCAELVTTAYQRSFFHPDNYKSHGIAIASARAGNVIGGGDWAKDRLVPDIMRAFTAHQTAKIRNPNSIRPWQHVLEPLTGYLTLAQRLYIDGPQFSGGWNFGPADGDAKPVEWIVRELSRHWGAEAKWELDQTTGPHEAHYLKLDCSKARTHLDWKERWTLSKALESIADWYRSTADGKCVEETTLAQINSFLSTGVKQ